MLCLAGFLVSCAAADPKPARVALHPVPPSGPVDPPDAAVRNSVRKFLAETGAPAASLFTFSRHDLDGDGRRDALVLFKNPYGYWCGLHGCTMLVMKAGDSDFTLVNSVEPVREPLYISDIKTNGWKNIIVHISGRTEKTKDVALQFDGEKYPSHPSELPPYLSLASNMYTKIFYK